MVCPVAVLWVLADPGHFDGPGRANDGDAGQHGQHRSEQQAYAAAQQTRAQRQFEHLAVLRVADDDFFGVDVINQVCDGLLQVFTCYLEPLGERALVVHVLNIRDRAGQHTHKPTIWGQSSVVEDLAASQVGFGRNNGLMAEPELASNVTDTALIFEGGAMRASYTAAVVAELVRARIFVDWVAGISAGATNLANYLSRDPLRARRSFVEFAADPRFGDLRTWRAGQGLFNSHYIYQQTSGPGQALPLDWQTFQANPARLAIGAFRADDAQMVYFQRDDVATLQDLLIRVQASSTMPLVMPPVSIDGHTFVDGALGPSGGIALEAAKAAGFSRFLVILTRPRGYLKKPSLALALAPFYFRQFPAIADALARRTRVYNQTRQELFDLESDGQAYLFMPTGFTVSTQERRLHRLRRSYDDGKAQFLAELPKIRDFLGLDAHQPAS